MRGLDTGHQGWTTVSGSRQSKSLPGNVERGPRTITRIDEYEINLLTTRCMTEERRESGAGAGMVGEGRLYGEGTGERSKQPWGELGRGDDIG